MATAFSNYNQTVFLNNQKLQGVTSVDGGYTVTHKPINIVGKGVVNQVVSEIPQADFSITRDLTFVDTLQWYTGSNRSFHGSINYGNRIFGFNEGYLTSYSYSVEYGETPISTLGITVFGNMGSGSHDATKISNLNASGDATRFIPKIPRPSDITLSCSGSESNRIKRFNVDVEIPRNPIYAINNLAPVDVHIAYPVSVSTSFVMEVDNFNARRIYDYLSNDTTGFDSFSIDVKGIVYDPVEMKAVDNQNLTLPDGTQLNFMGEDTYSVSQLWQFNSSNTKLVGQRISSSADSNMEVELSYITLLRNEKKDKNVKRA